MRICTLLVLSAAALSACASIAPQVKRSGAPEPQRIVLLPPSCDSVDGACDTDSANGVAGIVQTELDFAGFTVIDGRELIDDERTRTDAIAQVELLDVEIAAGAARVQSGAKLEDLSPEKRRALLTQARADGVVSVKIVVGPRDGIGPVRHNEVQVRMLRGDGEQPVWITRCSTKSGINPPIDQSLAKATRCALSGVLDDVRDLDLSEPAL